jgi:hypothetical protein
MARPSDPIGRFARFLAQSEHSPLTIKNYRSDLDAFAAWFERTNGEPMEPARITPTDLRQFKRWSSGVGSSPTPSIASSRRSTASCLRKPIEDPHRLSPLSQ